MSLDGFTVEGRDVTAKQLAREMVYSEGKIQAALESGRQTLAEIATHCELSVRAGLRKGYAAGRAAFNDEAGSYRRRGR